MSSSDSEPEEGIIKGIVNKFIAAYIDSRQHDANKKGEPIISQYLKEERKRLGTQAPRPMSNTEYKILSDKYIEEMTTTIPDRNYSYNSLFDGWIKLIRKGNAVGHVMLDQYGLQAMEHVDLEYIHTCQTSLQQLCTEMEVPISTFSVPTKKAIYCMLSHSPSVISVDYNNGYWSHMLKTSGGDVLQGDGCGSNCSKSVLTLLKTNRYHNRALFICPGSTLPIAQYIKAFRGQHLFIVGERNDNTDFDRYLKVKHPTSFHMGTRFHILT